MRCCAITLDWRFLFHMNGVCDVFLSDCIMSWVWECHEMSHSLESNRRSSLIIYATAGSYTSVLANHKGSAVGWSLVDSDLMLCSLDAVNSGVRHEQHAGGDDCGWLVTVRLVVASFRLMTVLSRIQLLSIQSLWNGSELSIFLLFMFYLWRPVL